MPPWLELETISLLLEDCFSTELEEVGFSLEELSAVLLDELSAELFAMMLEELAVMMSEELLFMASVFSSSQVPAIFSEQAKNVIEHARNKYLNWLITIPLFWILYLFYPLTEKVVSSGDKPD